MRTHTLALTLVLLAVSGSAAPAAPLSPMRVLVTNDDGVGAPGIDALVQVLSANPNLQLTVIAPATNQSGTGDQFTNGPIDVTPSSTAGAFPATAVAGKPADSVLFGVLHALAQPPDLVVSGVNFGQNAGEFVNLSGTVGAALTAARLGIPAIAASHGLFGSSSQFLEAATYVGQLVERFRVSRSFRAKLTTRSGARFALVLNVNFPSCSSGATRGVVLVPLGRATQISGYSLTSSMGNTQTFTPMSTFVNPFSTNCNSAVVNPPTDIDGLASGFATLTPLNPDLTVSQKLRSFRFLVR
jgi:5'-nucleotidase